MKKSEKKGIAILIVVAIIIIVIIFFVTRKNKQHDTQNNVQVEEFVKVLQDGTRLNTSTKLNETKIVNGLEFGNIQLTEKAGQSVLLADVKNNSGVATDLILIDIILLDREGNKIVKIGGIIPPLENGEQTQFNTSMTLDYANAYDFKVDIRK